MEITAVQQYLDLGLTGLLLVAIVFMAKYLIRKDDTISEKDSKLNKLNNDVLNVVKENTKTQVELRSTIKEHITLTERFYESFTNTSNN